MNRLAILPPAALAAALPAMLDSAVKGAVLLGLIALLVLFMRNAAAAARHLAWLVGMLGLLLLPLLSAGLPEWRVLPGWASMPFHSPILERVSVDEFIATGSPLQTSNTSSPAPFPALLPSTGNSHTLPANARDLPAPARPWRGNASLWLGGVWLAVAAVLLLRVALSTCLLRLSARHASRVTGGLLHNALNVACATLGIRRRIDLLLDQRRVVPLVWGVFRPRLVLPAEARTWSESRLSAVLLHELAHIKRGDLLAMMLTHVACALHWFNPLAWLAAWRLEVERERACDDLVLTAGVKASDYAGHLLHVATRLDAAGPAGALAMARPSRLKVRLLAVMNQRLKRNSVPRAVALLALALGLAVVVPMAMLRAQEKSATPRDLRGTGPIDVMEGSSAGQPPRASEIPALAEGVVQHTNRAGRWSLGGGVIMDVSQRVYHGADVASNAVLWWPAQPDRPALRHEFSLAADAFANREPWKMAWETNGAVLWIAVGERRFMGEDRDKKYQLARVRRLDFRDPAKIIETHRPQTSPILTSEAIRAVLTADFEIPPAAAGGDEHAYQTSARLEHTWVITGVTRNTAGESLGNVAIALTIENERHPFEQMRSDANGRFWTSLRPPLTALASGCSIGVKGNRINGIEPPAGFQETNIKLTAAEIARHAETAEPRAGSAAFTGTIQTPDGKPFSGALIAVIPDGDAVSGFTTRADSEGTFFLAPVPTDRDMSILVEASPQKRRGSVSGTPFAAGEVRTSTLTLAHGRGWEWNLTLQ